MDEMRGLIDRFPSQLEEALKIAAEADLEPADHDIRNVVVTGLGGSGIGGKIVSQLVADEVSVPILVNNDYRIPGFVNAHTLVIACSYSGNTEETISALKEATDQKATIACITSGGTIADLAQENGYYCIHIPGGYPPRAALGYAIVQQFRLLEHFGIIQDRHETAFRKAIDLLQQEKDQILKEAQRVREHLQAKTPVLYSEASGEGVVVRFRQQLNENAKVLCWHHALPEMNHNELVGWAGGDDTLAVVLFRHEDDHERTQLRMEISKDIFSRQGAAVTEVWSKGATPLEKTFYLIHVGDWVSWYLARERGVDPVEVRVIDHLKSELAKV